MFTLEALDANNGDCLFLHFGSHTDPKLIIIDGGPEFSGRSTFANAMAPRLDQISRSLGRSLPLPVKLLMVSHIDDDHIGGILRLMKRARPRANPLVDLEAVWHNSFDDFLNPNDLDRVAAFGRTSGSAAANFDPELLNVAAGVKQGIAMRDEVNRLNITPNAGTGTGFVSAGDSFRIGSMKMRILAPAKEELENLQAKFDADNPNIASMTASQRRNALERFTDDSVANLASIVVLAEQNGKTILLTGDARGDKILAALRKARLLRNGRITVDVLKVPHHGSDRNVSTDFFRKVRARHYVFSGDGAHGNPDRGTLEMLATARGGARYTMWFTHRLRHITDFLRTDRRNNNRRYKAEFPKRGEVSLWVDLEEALDF